MGTKVDPAHYCHVLYEAANVLSNSSQALKIWLKGKTSALLRTCALAA